MIWHAPWRRSKGALRLRRRLRKRKQSRRQPKNKEIVDAQKKGAGTNDKVSCLMLQDVFTGTLKQTIQAFETEQEFQKATDDEGQPYIVRRAQAWADLCENTADFKGLMEVFQAQFPASPACSNSGGRCQAPIKTLSGQTFAKVIDTLAACYLPAWVNECDNVKPLEHCALASKAKRMITAAKFEALRKLVPEAVPEQKKSIFSEKWTVLSLLQEITSTDNTMARAMSEKKDLFRTAIVGPGDVVYVPNHCHGKSAPRCPMCWRPCERS